MNKLAIIIPAFKSRFFQKTLSSLSTQTNKDFTVYIGDDCSPDDLISVIKKFEHCLNIIYTRFEKNIGAKNVILQWKRCVELSKDEEWIWLFSDDDLADESCVADFYKKIEDGTNCGEVYKFNTITIDQDDKPIHSHAPSPAHETSEELAFHLLLGKRSSTIADHIFSRKVYNACNGFVFTEYAQGADWATSILFSKKAGVYCISSSNFYWRYSGYNISSYTGSIKKQMLIGHLQFITWIIKHFEYLKTENKSISYKLMMNAVRTNLTSVIIYHYNGIEYKQIPLLIKFMRRQMKLGFVNIIHDLINIIQNTVILNGVNKAKGYIKFIYKKIVYK